MSNRKQRSTSKIKKKEDLESEDDSKIISRKVIVNGDILVDPDKHLPIIRKLAKDNFIGLSRTLMLLKAYLLWHFSFLPTEPLSLNDELFEIVGMVVIDSHMIRPRNWEENQRFIRRNLLYNRVKEFFNRIFEPELAPEDTFDKNKLCYLLPYWVTDMGTMYSNNITANLQKYVFKYVTLMLGVRDRVELLRNETNVELRSILDALEAPVGDDLPETEPEAAADGRTPLTAEQLHFLRSNLHDETKAAIARIRAEAKQVKEFLMGDPAAPIPAALQHLEWLILEFRTRLPPLDAVSPNVAYDVQVQPLAYFPAMLWMVGEMERLHPGTKLPNVCPLKRTFIVDHFTMDTRVVLQFLCSASSRSLYDGSLKKNRGDIWGEVFRTNRAAFKAKFAEFGYFARCDGFSMSINMVLKKGVTARDLKSEQYVQQLTEQEKERLKGKKLVAYDPNKGNLVFAVDGNGKDANVFRYTAQYRRVQGGMKKHGKRRLKIKKEERVGGVSMESIESSLSAFSAKTTDLASFLAYVHQRSIVRVKLNDVYTRLCWRKFKFRQHVETVKCENKVMKEFADKFGKPEEVVVAAGNYSAVSHMRGRRPVPGVGTRKMFKRHGYPLLLVDEYRTSKCCSHCGGKDWITLAFNEQFLSIPHPRYSNRGSILSWSILRCTSCGMIWNRDRNAAINIGRIAEGELHGEGRPPYLRRADTPPVVGGND